jgi:hypothetical protein
MEDKHIRVPENKNYEYGLEQAYKLVCEKLLKIEDFERQCSNSGSNYWQIDSKKIISIRYLNRLYNIVVPDIEISLADSTEEVSLRERVLILHYFTQAKGTPLSGQLITFRELPEGKVYLPTFSKRTVNPLMENFGREPLRMVEVSKELGGRETDYGDTAVTIDAFPRVPLTMVIWHGDEEFAPQGNIVFDASITDYLSTEDITVVSEIITWKLVRLSREA